MPIYEYECTNCEEKFELLRNINDSDKSIKCPCCNKQAAKRVFSVFGTASSSSDCVPSPTGGST